MFIALAYIGYSIWFFVKRDTFDELMHEWFLLTWAGFTVMIIQEMHPAHLLWMIPTTFGIYAMFIDTYSRSPKSAKVWMVVTIGFFLSIFLQG